jgi:hypothetical protein
MRESEAETAARLGLCRPYALGPNVGKCPGGAEYGHGMSLTTVHGLGCCEAWNQARAEAAADTPETSTQPEPEAG